MTDDTEPQPIDERDVVDASSPEGVRKAGKEAKRKKERGRDFWKAVLSDTVGRAEIWRLLTEAHTFEERFACGPGGFPQPEATWFHAGEQSFGMRFYQTLLLTDVDAVKLMHTEHDPRWEKVEK